MNRLILQPLDWNSNYTPTTTYCSRSFQAFFFSLLLFFFFFLSKGSQVLLFLCDVTVLSCFFFSPRRNNTSCTVRWAPLSSFVRSVPRTTRMWRLSPVVISCALPVSLPGRYKSGCMQGGLCGLFMCHNSNLLRSELSVEVLFYSDMSDTKRKNPFLISACSNHLPFGLCCRSQKVREQDVPFVAVRLRVRSR